MAMSSTVTLAYEGPPSCRDCQRDGIPVCAHIGFNDAAWVGMPGTAVAVPGLDPSPEYRHVVRTVEISADRKTVTLVVDTQRPQHMDLARHLSTLPTPKAMVRAVHAETGEALAEGGYDAFLREGQQVWVNGTSHLVTGVEHPHRHPEHGTVADGLDWQVATLQPQPEPAPVTVVEEN